jgi:hypothetical protein
MTGTRLDLDDVNPNQLSEESFLAMQYTVRAEF